MLVANADTTSPHDLVAGSRRLRHAVHHRHDSSELFDSLADLDEGVLDVLRDDPDAATAFWLNLHGALVERARSSGAREWCRVAGVRVDAATAFHGILRAGRWKHGFGYLPHPFADRFERRHRLRDLDARVHFAVLAARHAPGLSVTYTAANVDGELDAVARAYLDATAEHLPSAGVVRVPRVFLWYRGDFGGRSGILSLLAEYDVVPADASPRLSYTAASPAAGSERAPERPPEDPQ
ncbi:DUF547 domain-containing protein [Halobacterium litoreum]|uniref:DUF547 domain-containing protein n=1 Tax=Halobacterium litoreum TaxID=2039234 RepID=A0ABD5ND35_9EURY|nr:DUF547 domain-containing protein [Halobacterium litoreum]UHH14080.1 DUF547 domain-containing protein [Halobacterium litoreum]